ncbi:MAG TPA: asparagine synthase (glutamine-hydrolyzing) [Candidatus Polarisedimenticolia bacterium]|nr:asparagine synthase (glutamine-hydrolyzing) [Candidatus Polarisedimenticolia bacterium]
MGGLAGILSLDGTPVQHTCLKAMTEALRHRGPDEGAAILLGDAERLPPGAAAPRSGADAVRLGSRVGLGHRRLKVVDLSGAAAQPMRHASGAWLIYDGELYNTAELRSELSGRGARFRSRSDTEVVLEALCAWGPAALGRFNGMFALAFWDARARRLILARDRFGEKPLYYARTKGLLLFASELGALVRQGDVPLEIDPEALELYLTFGFIPAPWTIYRGARKLPQASWLEARPGAEPIVSPYYRLITFRDREVRGAAEDLVRSTLREAVRRRLEADVPLGAFLSGGLDSTAVVALMRGVRSRPTRTYSTPIPDLPSFHESSGARRTAELLGTLHQEIQVDAARLQAEVPFVLGRFDEPFADPSVLASSVIAREARRDVTVALSGDGGDEVFGGYRLYRALASHALLRRLPAGVAGALMRLLSPFPARHGGGLHGAVRQARRLLDGAGSELAEAHASWMSVCGTHSRRSLRPGMPDADLARSLVEERYRRFGGGLDAALAVEVDLALSDDLLVKVDRTSMSRALEVRAPFLDPDLVELALCLPARAHFGALYGKRLLRKALDGVIPRHALRAPGGRFEVPVGRWLIGPLDGLYRDIASPSALAEIPGVDPIVPGAWLTEHRDRVRDHGPALWMLFALCLWHQGAHREHAGAAGDVRRQLRARSSSEATVLRRSEG